MKQITLARLLLDFCDESHFRIAEKVNMTPSNFSKLINKRTRLPKSLERLAAFFTQQLNAEVDANVLHEECDGKTLLALALHLRSQRLKKAAAAMSETK